MSEKQQIAVELSEDVFEALKQRAEETGQTIDEIVEQAIVQAHHDQQQEGQEPS